MADEMALGDHIEVWLADAREVVFPRLWFLLADREITITSEEGCDAVDPGAEGRYGTECKQWFRRQIRSDYKNRSWSE
jgi:hypothetical protein